MLAFAKYLPLLLRYRREIRTFLPIVQALLALLRDNAPRAVELRDRPQTNSFRDLVDLTVETEEKKGYSGMSDDKVREMFKI